MADSSAGAEGGGRMKNQRIYMCEDSLEGILSADPAAYDEPLWA